MRSPGASRERRCGTRTGKAKAPWSAPGGHRYHSRVTGLPSYNACQDLCSFVSGERLRSTRRGRESCPHGPEHRRGIAGTVRRSLRDIFAELEKDYPNLKQTMLTAMGNLRLERLLDPRFVDDGLSAPPPAVVQELLPILQ